MAIKAKDKGNKYELAIASFFRNLGWTECVTSRSESKRLDDVGIDLCYTHPFNVQTKALERTPPYHVLLQTMPKKHDQINLVFHKRNNKGTVVVMDLDAFEHIVKQLIKAKVIKPNV